MSHESPVAYQSRERGKWTDDWQGFRAYRGDDLNAATYPYLSGRVGYIMPSGSLVQPQAYSSGPNNSDHESWNLPRFFKDYLIQYRDYFLEELGTPEEIEAHHRAERLESAESLEGWQKIFLSIRKHNPSGDIEPWEYRKEDYDHSTSKKLRERIKNERWIQGEAGRHEREATLAFIPFLINVLRSKQPIAVAAGIPIDLANYVRSGTGEMEIDGDLSRSDPVSYRNNLGVPIKEVLVRVADWDAIERSERTITTSSFTPYSRFYDWILMGYKIEQIPKLVWNDEEEKYEDQSLPDHWIPDYEREARQDLEAIKKSFPLANWQIPEEGEERLVWNETWQEYRYEEPDEPRPDVMIMRQLKDRALWFRNSESDAPPMAQLATRSFFL